MVGVSTLSTDTGANLDDLNVRSGGLEHGLHSLSTFDEEEASFVFPLFFLSTSSEIVTGVQWAAEANHEHHAHCKHDTNGKNDCYEGEHLTAKLWGCFFC